MDYLLYEPKNRGLLATNTHINANIRRRNYQGKSGLSCIPEVFIHMKICGFLERSEE